MKWINSFIIPALTVGSFCFGQTSTVADTKSSTEVSPGYSITVTPPAGPFRLGSPINLTVTARNISDNDVYWESEFPDTAYRAFTVLLTNDSGEVETTFLHRRVRSKQRLGDPPEVEHGGSILSSIAPGKSLKFTIDLTRLYQITKPGR
jgi:hypothetical protein